MKNTAFFFDGQNLFRSTKDLFGYNYPNFDVIKLIQHVSAIKGLKFGRATFYTGVPRKEDDEYWNHFWSKKLLVIKNSGIDIVHRTVRYNPRDFWCPKGHKFTASVGAEKGVDVRLALDIVKTARDPNIEAIVVFSQDQDLNEAMADVIDEAKSQRRFINLYSAYPFANQTRNAQGIDKTTWVRIEKPAYDLCIDPIDYRPAPKLATSRDLARLEAKFNQSSK